METRRKRKERKERFNGPWFLVPCYGKREHSPWHNRYCVDCGLVFRKRNKVTGGPIFVGSSGNTLKTKYRLLLRDGNHCHYCEVQFDEGENQPTIDHVIPRSKGGENCIENYVLACYPCNQSKGDMTKAEFLVWMKQQQKEVGD